VIASESFVGRYLNRVAQTGSVFCVGLESTWKHLPPNWIQTIYNMEQYLCHVIDIASTRVSVVKPQYAYYASPQFDDKGIPMMIRLIEYAHQKGLVVILDGKRADIDETMEQYGDEVFGRYGVDACTFVPYLGSTFMPSKSSPSWQPWLEKGRAAITMVRTSNPGAIQLQDLELKNGLLVYEQLAKYASEWNQTVSDTTE
jgi:orotidine-5'-phosphate decarboxylase